MTRPLRRAHFYIWMALPPILAALLIAGLAVRRETMPVNPAFHTER
jgi:hypothetical protein